MALIAIAFVLPLKKVEGDHMKKLKQIDGLGCAISFAASILILIPISW